ncbi:MAG TPA: hypothetical protein VF796_27745 [Humisphaera sp.]
MGTATLQLRSMHHLSGGRDRFTYDFVVDGVSLAGTLRAGHLVGRIDVAGGEGNAAAVKVLLRLDPADVPPDRVMLFVCSECGDIGCGAVTAAVTLEADAYVWSDFRQENGYDEGMTERHPDVGPFRFAAAEYRALLGGLAAPA